MYSNFCLVWCTVLLEETARKYTIRYRCHVYPKWNRFSTWERSIVTTKMTTKRKRTILLVWIGSVPRILSSIIIRNSWTFHIRLDLKRTSIVWHFWHVRIATTIPITMLIRAATISSVSVTDIEGDEGSRRHPVAPSNNTRTLATTEGVLVVVVTWRCSRIPSADTSSRGRMRSVDLQLFVMV